MEKYFLKKNENALRTRQWLVFYMYEGKLIIKREGVYGPNRAYYTIPTYQLEQ
jgi:hypothetical protein